MAPQPDHVPSPRWPQPDVRDPALHVVDATGLAGFGSSNLPVGSQQWAPDHWSHRNCTDCFWSRRVGCDLNYCHNMQQQVHLKNTSQALQCLEFHIVIKYVVLKNAFLDGIWAMPFLLQTFSLEVKRTRTGAVLRRLIVNSLFHSWNTSVVNFFTEGENSDVLMFLFYLCPTYEKHGVSFIWV